MNTTRDNCIFMQRWLRRSALVLLAMLCSNLFAAEAKDGFQFELSPYLWAAAIKGSTAADGDEAPPVDSGYSFFSLDNLDGVASARFTGRKAQLGFLFDFLYVAYEDTFLEGKSVQTTMRFEGTILEFGLMYMPRSIDNVEFITGLRQQDITVSLELLGRKPEQAVTWVDPFVGIIYSHAMVKSFYLNLRADIGGFGIESDKAVNAEAMLRYQVGDTFAIKFGYRYLKVTFDESGFVYDVSLDGFLLGLGILF